MMHTLTHRYPVRVIAKCQAISRDPNDRDIVTHITCDTGEEFIVVALGDHETTIVRHGDTDLEIPAANIVRIDSLTCDDGVAV